MKRAISLLLLAALLLCPFGGTGASAAGLADYVTVKGFDPKVDYMGAMWRALQDGSSYAMQMGAIYEMQRNLKISTLGMKEKQTHYFAKYTTAAEILAAMAADKKPKYSEEDLDLLARIIYAEAGCTCIPNWVQRMGGSVVLNRVKSPYYPNTIREVIYQPGQYSPAWNGSINWTPDNRTRENARYLLENGSICPGNVIGQNSIITGSGVYRSYYDSILGTTIYFCYM